MVPVCSVESAYPRSQTVEYWRVYCPRRSSAWNLEHVLFTFSTNCQLPNAILWLLVLLKMVPVVNQDKWPLTIVSRPRIEEYWLDDIHCCQTTIMYRWRWRTTRKLKIAGRQDTIATNVSTLTAARATELAQSCGGSHYKLCSQHQQCSLKHLEHHSFFEICFHLCESKAWNSSMFYRHAGVNPDVLAGCQVNSNGKSLSQLRRTRLQN